jgi:hypothetical protein
VSVAAALTMIPLPDAARIPAKFPVASMVIDLVMVTTPKLPGSITLISPLAAVLLMAPGKVLQGAVRLHGLTSSPTPETQVREACACVAELIGRHNTTLRVAAAISFRAIIPRRERSRCIAAI